MTTTTATSATTSATTAATTAGTPTLGTGRTVRTARRTAVAGLLALAVLGGTAAAGTTAATAHAPSAAAVSAAHTTHTKDFGYLTRISRTPRGTTLTLDRAIMLTGAAAAKERARRGLDPTPEFYIVNDNPLLRTFRVAPGVKVYGGQLLTGSPTRKPISLARLAGYLRSRPAGHKAPPFTLVLDRQRRVVQIAEFYLP